MEAPSASGWAGEGWGREDGRREGGFGETGSPQGTLGEGVVPPGPPGILYPTGPLRPRSQFKSNNFGLRLPPACHVPTQSFFKIRSCS